MPIEVSIARPSAGTLGAMAAVETARHLSPAQVDEVCALIARSERNGERPLSDHLWIDLATGGGAGFGAVIARDGGRITGYAQLSRVHESTAIELVVDPSEVRLDGLGRTLLSAALGLAAEAQLPARWTVQDASPAHDSLAATLGLVPERGVLQLRRPLPIGLPVELDTRPFVVGVDEQAWLEVNNRAFAEHPEQGGWDLDTLRSRQREEWFDPSGFLLHERDGRLAAFCWTKIHAEHDPVLGEIYVIAVDPAFHGLGLGKAMTLAGLEHLSAKGVEVGMLFVDSANDTALSLYSRLGFALHRTDRAYAVRDTSNETR